MRRGSLRIVKWRGVVMVEAVSRVEIMRSTVRGWGLVGIFGGFAVVWLWFGFVRCSVPCVVRYTLFCFNV